MKSLLLLALSVLLSAGADFQPAADVVTLHYEGSAQPGELTCPVHYYLWLPPGVAQVRGILVHQHGCGSGAENGCLAAAEDLHWRALAEKHRCALLGTSYRAGDHNCAAWADPRRGAHAHFLRSLKELATKTRHPELLTAPWCLWGHSGGGWWASTMLALEPERCVAVWLRSGSVFGTRPAEDDDAPPPPVPEAALRVPVMASGGSLELKDDRFRSAYQSSLTHFQTWRKRGALIGFAADPAANHECGGSRYLAIPFFDACLHARLPEKPGPLRAMSGAAWLAAPLSAEISPAAAYHGDPLEAVWLPDETVARAYSAQMNSGRVPDTTPPPPPYAAGFADGVLTWQAKADFESGLRGFLIERDGQPIGTVPDQMDERTVFQGLSFHDTPSQPVPQMRYADAAGKTGAVYRITAVNTSGLKSATAASVTVAVLPWSQREKSIVYGEHGGTPLTLDVFHPAAAKNGAGVILLASGGWASSRGMINSDFAAPYLERGYTVFAVVHASCPPVMIPQILPSVHRAVRYVRHHAARYGVDPARLGITGGSSGGHLALIIATQGTAGDAQAADPVDRESSAVQAVACFFPPTDFLNYVKPGINSLDESVLKNFQKFIGDVPADAVSRDALGRRISPLYSVTGSSAPSLLIHGDQDWHVRPHQSSSFVEAMQKAGAAARLIRKPGAAHGWKNMAAELAHCADWFDAHLTKVMK